MSIKIKFEGCEGSGKSLTSSFIKKALRHSNAVTVSQHSVRSMKGIVDYRQRDEMEDELIVEINDFSKFFNSIEHINVFDSIEKWAHDRNLIAGATPQAQMLKMTEEVGELAGAIARKDLDKIKDGIGDCVVVLTILAEQYDMTIEECIEIAYDEIKDRKGKMVDGIFIKEEA